MASIGFIGLGNMGGPMADNLVKAGHQVRGFDLSADSVARFVAAGGHAADSVATAVAGADVVVTMLPAGKHVRDVYTGDGGLISVCEPGTLMIDSSTIDVETARDVIAQAEAAGHRCLMHRCPAARQGPPPARLPSCAAAAMMLLPVPGHF